MVSRVDGGPAVAALAGDGTQTPRLRRALALTNLNDPDRIPEAEPGVVLLRHALARLVLELLHYEVLIRLRAEPEDVHRARSTVRRLRAVFRGLRAFLDRVWADTLREELRWFAGELASVRDIDVTIQDLRARSRLIPATERPYLESVFEPLSAARDDARHRLLVTLDGSRYIGLVHALERAAMMPKLSVEPLPSTGEIAARTMRKTCKRAHKAVESASSRCTPAELHHARIVLRNGRYVAEACAPVVGKTARRLAKRLGRMQEALGAVNDTTLIENRLRALVVHERASILVGELLGMQAVEGDKARGHWQSLRREALRKGWLHA